jgi:hypothetical protein
MILDSDPAVHTYYYAIQIEIYTIRPNLDQLLILQNKQFVSHSCKTFRVSVFYLCMNGVCACLKEMSRLRLDGGCLSVVMCLHLPDELNAA